MGKQARKTLACSIPGFSGKMRPEVFEDLLREAGTR